MNSYKNDYTKLYQLQDKFLSWLVKLGLPFYLTGGTALGRFYLHHRASDDLDFFVNADPHYPDYISDIKSKIATRFQVNMQQSLFNDDVTRFFILEDDASLKIEFINDVDYYVGSPIDFKYGLIDSPANILANKITALIGRDEPKDIFDIIHLSLNFSFIWMDMFHHAKQKAVLNEFDVEQRLASFPIEWLRNVNWLKQPIDIHFARKCLNQIADDFLLGRSNTLAIDCPPIESAKPVC